VLRTNRRISGLQVVLRYRNLLAVEDAFKTAKALLATRPIFHKTDAGIRATSSAPSSRSSCARSSLTASRPAASGSNGSASLMTLPISAR
jgi:hypothetical protein